MLKVSAQRKTTSQPKFDLEGGGFSPRRPFLGGATGFMAFLTIKQNRGHSEPRNF